MEFLIVSISQAFLIYPQIDWAKELNSDVKDKGTKFIAALSNMAHVYQTTNNFLPASVIQDLFTNICCNLVETFRKQVQVMAKVENKANAREY
jgi:hypothetical protein